MAAANDRQFTLVGNFTDNISGKLAEINQKLDGILGKLEKYKAQYTELASVVRSFGAAVEATVHDIRDQGKAVSGTATALREYNRALAQTNRLNKSGGLRFLNAIEANKRKRGLTAAKIRGQRLKSNAQAEVILSRARRNSGGGGGGGGGGYRRAGGGGYGGGYSGYVVGNQVGQVITGSIISGFQFGVGLMRKPFDYFVNAFGERMRDEIADIQAATGLFSVSQRSSKPFVKNFREALLLQEETNRSLGRFADALPGGPDEFIGVGKRLSDSVARVVTNSTTKSIALANKVIAANPEVFGAKLIQGESAADRGRAISVLTADLAKQTTLAGYGGRSGVGGAQGPYGFPGLAERILTQDQVSVAQFQRYSAIFSNPLILQSLKERIGEINASAAGTPERLEVLNKLLKDIVPPEAIAAFERSATGTFETLQALLFSRETGLFGLGRPLAEAVPVYNEFGELINENNEVVKSVSEAAKENLSLFKYFRDIFTNFGRPLAGILRVLPEIYDPLSQVAQLFVKAREFSFKFLNSFEKFLAGYTAFAETFTGDEKLKFLENIKSRAALDTVADLFESLGIFSKEFRATKITPILKDPDGNLGDVVTAVLEGFFESDAATKVGNFIGTIIGSVLNQVAAALGFVEKIVTGSNLANGFVEGFTKSGGKDAIGSIFRNLGKLFLMAIGSLFAAAPLETAILAGVTFGLPILSAALTEVISAGVVRAARGIKGNSGSFLAGLRKKYQRRAGLTAYKLPIGPQPGPGYGTPIANSAGTVGPLAQFGNVIKSILAPLTKLTLIIAAVTAALVLLGGGVDNTLRQFQQIFGEIGHTLVGIFGGLSDVFGGLFGIIGDIGASILRLISGTDSAADGFQVIKFLLVPLTAPLQALETGLRGLAVLLAAIRLWWAKQFGTKKEQEDAEKEKKRLEGELYGARGRHDAYNTSVRGDAALRKELNDALYLYNNKKNLKEAEGARLKAFIDEARALLGVKPTSKPKPGKNTPSSIFTTGGAVAADSATAESVENAASVTADTIAPSTLRTETNTKKTEENTKKSVTTLGNIKAALVSISIKMDALTRILTSGALKVQFQLNGTGGKGGPGMVDQFNPLAQHYGLQITSGYRPGDKGYHGANRARDYSNGTGPTPQMMSFARFMASNFGGSLAELIYTPLGFSIKNGKIVPPYAQQGHYNHVHVAYGLGYPTAFSSLNGARAFERAVTPGSVKIASVTGRSDEGFGSSVNVTNNITLVQQPGQSADELASIVALKISNEVNKLAYI